MTPLAISPYWITVPLGILMFLWLVLELRASRSKAKQLAPESVEDFAKALVSKFETETKAISTELPRTPGDHPEESVIEEPLIMVPDNITPEYLVGLYVQHTEIHANSLAKFYIDKGIIVSGFVIDVPEILDLTIAYMRSEPGKVFISLRFDKKWSGRVSILTRNTPIRVIGQIKEISGNKLNLHRCELL